MNDLPGPLEVLREIARGQCTCGLCPPWCSQCTAARYLSQVDKWKDYKVRVLTEDTYLVSAPNAELAKARVFLGKHKGEARFPLGIEATDISVVAIVESNGHSAEG